MFKKISLICSVLAFIAVLTLLLDHRIKPVPATIEDIAQKSSGEEAPDFTFTDIRGKHGRLSQFKGKVVILHFWATWCPPCLSEFPKLVKTAAQFQNQIVVLAISSDDAPADIKSFAAKKAIDATRHPNVTFIWDKNRTITHDLYQTFAYPETIVIDAQRNMIRKIPGDADWTSPEMISWLKSLFPALAEKPGTP